MAKHYHSKRVAFGRTDGKPQGYAYLADGFSFIHAKRLTRQSASAIVKVADGRGRPHWAEYRSRTNTTAPPVFNWDNPPEKD
jgi:hypothetical protein